MYQPERFLKNLEFLMRRHGMATEQEFEKIINMRGAFYSWKMTDKEGKPKKYSAPQAETLLKIAKHFNVSIDWLLTGEPQTLSVQEQGTTYTSPAISPEARMEIKIRIRQYLKKTRQSLDPEAEAKLEVLLEDYYREMRELPDDQIIKAYLILARPSPRG